MILEYQIKFRRKGEVVTSEEFVLPGCLAPNGDERGVDLTKYSVIYFRGKERLAPEILKSTGVEIVANYDRWTGSKLFLRDGFNPRKATYYKPDWQILREQNAAKEEQTRQVLSQVTQILGDKYNVGMACTGHAIEIVPKNWRVYSLSSEWVVRASSVEEAVSRVNERKSSWEDWSRRVTDLIDKFDAAGFSTAEVSFGHNEIEVKYRPANYKGPILLTRGIEAAIQKDGSLKITKTYTNNGSVWVWD